MRALKRAYADYGVLGNGGDMHSGLIGYEGELKTMRCPKCGSDFDQLACPVCTRNSSLQALSERMATSLRSGSALHYTRTGHLTLGCKSWRAIWRDWGVRPNRGTDIPTVCGVPHIYGQISEVTTASPVDAAKTVLGEQFHPCEKCAGGQL